MGEESAEKPHSVMSAKVCPKCSRVHVRGEVVALSRFAGMVGYRTADGALHQTRQDGLEYLCSKRTQANSLPEQADPC